MATYSKQLLSGSTQGKAIKVASVVTSATITTTSATISSGTVTATYTTSANHGLSSGQIVTITGNSVAAYNRTNATLATASGTTFTITYSDSSAPANGSGGTVVRQDMGAGTTIHATGTSSSVIDEVWLYAYNGDVSPRQLVIQYGGTTYIDNDNKITIPSQSGLTLVVAGLILTGTGSAANTIAAYASAANVITISGYVNRIS